MTSKAQQRLNLMLATMDMEETLSTAVTLLAELTEQASNADEGRDLCLLDPKTIADAEKFLKEVTGQ